MAGSPGRPRQVVMMARRRKPGPALADKRLSLVEEAADFFRFAHHRRRTAEEHARAMAAGYSTPSRGEGPACDPHETLHDLARMEQVIAEHLSEDEIALARSVAAGEIVAPWPGRDWPEDAPTALHDLAFPERVRRAEVANLEDRRRRKR